MKRTIFTIAFMFAALWAFAQDGFNYKILLSQGTNVLANQAVTLRLTLKDGGTTVYQETHSTTTDANGIASVVIGTGTVVSGNFSNIDWTKAISLQTEVSTDGGSSYTDFGTTDFQYTPYAKMSASAQKLEPTNSQVIVHYGNTLHNRGVTLSNNAIKFSQYVDDVSGVDWEIWMGLISNTLYIDHDGTTLVHFYQSSNLTKFPFDVEIDGELHGDDSGDADMKAYIYGRVDGSGTLVSNASSDGFTASKVGTGHYKITFGTAMSSSNSYTVVVSAFDSSSPQIVTYDPNTSDIDIYIWDRNGNAVDSAFDFVVFKK